MTMRTAVTELVGVAQPIVGFNRSPSVVAALGEIRPATAITRQIVADCEQRIAELGGLLPRSSAPPQRSAETVQLVEEPR